MNYKYQVSRYVLPLNGFSIQLMDTQYLDATLQ
jgi:hypothetical protein